jgi:hypothetical protein
MAEEHARWKQYEYASNSNLVLTAERRTRENEPSGEAETLANKRLFKMGDKAQPDPLAVPGHIRAPPSSPWNARRPSRPRSQHPRRKFRPCTRSSASIAQNPNCAIPAGVFI